MKYLKIAAQAFETGNFLYIFLKFWRFGGSFSYKKACIPLDSVRESEVFWRFQGGIEMKH